MAMQSEASVFAVLAFTIAVVAFAGCLIAVQVILFRTLRGPSKAPRSPGPQRPARSHDLREHSCGLPASQVLSNLRHLDDDGSREVMVMLDAMAEEVFTKRQLVVHVSPVDDVEGLVAFLHSLAGVIELHWQESQELQRELDDGPKTDG